MKKIYILGNWKANKTLVEAKVWLDTMAKHPLSRTSELEIILCPAYHHISLFVQSGLPFSIGSQDVSQYPQGAYTGEVSAEMLVGSVTYTLIGHSERRLNLGETDEIVGKKVQASLAQSLIPIVCVSELSHVRALLQVVPEFAKSGLLLYEPLSAIGSGTPMDAASANEKAREIHTVMAGVPILYGGSVTAETTTGFCTQTDLSGVGIGGASLLPEKFIACISQAQKLAGL